MSDVLISEWVTFKQRQPYAELIIEQQWHAFTTHSQKRRLRPTSSCAAGVVLSNCNQQPATPHDSNEADCSCGGDDSCCCCHHRRRRHHRSVHVVAVMTQTSDTALFGQVGQDACLMETPPDSECDRRSDDDSRCSLNSSISASPSSSSDRANHEHRYGVVQTDGGRKKTSDTSTLLRALRERDEHIKQLEMALLETRFRLLDTQNQLLSSNSCGNTTDGCSLSTASSSCASSRRQFPPQKKTSTASRSARSSSLHRAMSALKRATSQDANRNSSTAIQRQVQVMRSDGSNNHDETTTTAKSSMMDRRRAAGGSEPNLEEIEKPSRSFHPRQRRRATIGHYDDVSWSTASRKRSNQDVVLVEGHVLKACRSGGLVRRRLVLLSHALAYCQPSSSFSSSSSSFSSQHPSSTSPSVRFSEDRVYPLHEVLVEPYERVGFTVRSPHRSFLVQCSNERDRDLWVSAIRRQTELILQREGAKSPEESELAPVWRSEKEVSCCELCEKPFGVLYWKHRCKSCGCVVCSICSTRSHLLNRISSRPVRVCDRCEWHRGQQEEEAEGAVLSVQDDQDLLPYQSMVTDGVQALLLPSSSITEASKDELHQFIGALPPPSDVVDLANSDRVPPPSFPSSSVSGAVVVVAVRS